MKHLAFLLLSMAASLDTFAFNGNTDSVKTVALDSVVVTGRVPRVRQNGGTTRIMVDKTVLSRMGALDVMLAHTPGLHSENGEIVVNGKGQPIFVVDGRIIKDNAVLSTLQADNIKHIEIDRLPSVEFSPDGAPVIRITSKRHINDYAFLNIGNYTKMTRMFSDIPMLNASLKVKKVSMSLNYVGGSEGSKNKETYYRDIYRDNNTFNIIMSRENPMRVFAQRLNYALDYNLDSHNRLGLYYFYMYNRTKDDITGSDNMGYDGDLKQKDILRHSTEHGNTHNVSAQYEYKRGNNNLNITQDVLFKSVHKNSMTEEVSDTYKDSYGSNGETDYFSSSTTAKYRCVLPWKIGALFGGEFNYVSSNSDVRSDASFVAGGLYKNEIKLTERNPRLYISLNRRIGKFSIEPALTYSYTYRSVTNNLTDNDNITQHFSTFSPSIKVKYAPNNKLRFTLGYSSYESQPNFSQMNSGLSFSDSLAYTMGNPSLKPTQVNKANIIVSWKDLSLTVSYTHRHNPIVNVETLTDPQSNIVTTSAVNFNKTSDWRVQMSYSHTFSKLSVYSEAELALPNGEYTFLGATHKANKAAFNGQINIEYAINDWINMFTDFTYQGYNVMLTKTQKPVSAWNIGIVASLLKNRFNVYFAVKDVFGEENYNNLYYCYGNIKHGTYGKNDMRGVELKLSYTLFSKDISVKASNSNSRIIDRL